ncbi:MULTISPECIES: tripartite tricarboxylate transporter substrate-binding protein [unclassified Achromobacter]|uniref:tripartite tricarboxylate transporter substrate-binding protein n=1 Tax=unclassified Achromobacter TaxID=2626865 RepID=UPI001303BEF6|nr:MULTISPECIES: tripartite tricarboxylate transporter substrate-binding protein [unclassified Achromobacter]
MKLMGGAALARALPAHADDAHPGVVRLLVGFPPGATGDRIARAAAPVFAAHLQSNVIVENKSGAGGQLAVGLAKTGPADGSVLLQTIGSSMVIYPHTYRNLPYDPLHDFIPIGTVATAPIAFVSAPTVPAKTLKEAVSLIRQEPKLGFYGSPASGSVFHFSGVLLQRAMGCDFTHVAYRGSAPALADVLSGQVPFAFLAPSDILDHHRAGKLRILAVTGTARASQLPDVPVFPEEGYKELVNQEWFSYFLTRGAGAATVDRYRAALHQVVTDEKVRTALLTSGLEMGDGSPTTLAQTMNREYGQWKKLVAEIGFVAD